MKLKLLETREIEKQALVPEGSMIRFRALHRSYNGYLIKIPKIHDIESSYCIVSDNLHVKLTPEHANNIHYRDTTIDVRIDVSGEEVWYECDWVSEHLKYKYKDTVVDTSYKIMHEQDLVTVVRIDEHREVLAGTVIAVSDNQIVADVNGKFVVFDCHEDDEYTASTCNEYAIEGEFSETTKEERANDRL